MQQHTTCIGRPMEFHVSREARRRYQFDEALFSVRGNVIFANFHAARRFAQKMNDQRDVARQPERAVSAAQLNALGLLHEILHLVVEQYRRQRNPQVMQQALAWLDEQVGGEQVDTALRTFAAEFPPLAVHRGELDPAMYLTGTTDGVSNREIVLEEMLMLWLSNANPACESFLELFDDGELEQQTAYSVIIDGLQRFFDDQPGFGPQNESLIAVLRAPPLASPHSLIGQLEFLRDRFGVILGDYLFRILSSLDFIREEARMFWGPGGPGPVEVYDFTGADQEQERFTPDRDWMPRLVLMAKNAFVWLDQLSKKYGRPLTRLDEVPDEELDMLGRWGITGLWLIGLWERSAASKRIKQMMGNPDAVASAYSLFDYQIAHDLGGEEAINGLRQRAWQRGIRLASDMVPNHMGIDSRWVVQHPDWFISLPYPPFPAYTFNGPDLSWDERVGIFLEDHYYNHSDAAVVFKRVDRWTGDERYIYHGNDGTSMPWNDTAQLNFLKPDVREAVIQTILHVARQFPIIRFDAAMTLAKKHYHRLWFPEPGSGGDIPSRAEHGLTKAQFDALMPQEFWREVVDRAAVEAPDTLLLAEAFWLMESYFVRTLGMHRVYNSAFMNILRDEENVKYRQIMKNTLEFDPEVLKRFVNFMNNPDERTAVDQFGKGDKYFGICTLMVTLPGLPMLGHGQVEGFAEKYGMEYRRAYWDERPDNYLVHRHEQETFPLLHRRYLFAEVDNFRLYDLFTPEGWVTEDVFAYSNRYGDEKALVIYHNKFATVSGWLKTSVAYAVKAGGGERRLTQQNLAEALGLHNDENYFCLFRDHLTGLQYIRNSKQLHEQGLFVELDAYRSHVFLNFREVQDTEWQQYRNLAEYLAGRGVPSIEEAALEIVLQPVLEPFRQLVHANTLRRLLQSRVTVGDGRAQPTTPTVPTEAGKEPVTALDTALLDEVEQKLLAVFRGIKQFTHSSADEAALAKETRQKLEALLQLPVLGERFPADTPEYQAAAAYLQTYADDLAVWGPLFGWVFTHTLGKLYPGDQPEEQSRAWIDEWRLDRVIASSLQTLGLDGGPAWRAAQGIKVLLDHRNLFDGTAGSAEQAYRALETGLKQPEVQSFLQVNRYQDVVYFNKEAFDQLLWWSLALAAVDSSADPTRSTDEVATAVGRRYTIIRQIQKAEAQSEYQVEKLLALVKESTSDTVETPAASATPRKRPTKRQRR